MRVATSFDAHQYDPDRPLWLACLEWPGEIGLAGHSDADVAAHAACDALLMASGIGELGTIFGTDRPEWAGASGARLLGETVRLVTEAGWRIENVSVQIIGQRPRFAPRKREAEAAMSKVVGAPVTVSATTSDRMGFTGRGEGLAAIATALLVRGHDAPPEQW
nr:2-C-methyl-D-erythritol 2,4-cyclodiphosphate synthase [Trueperella bialowiezensis]